MTKTVGSEAIINAAVSNTPIFVRSSNSCDGSLKDSLVLNNIKLNNIPIAVGVCSLVALLLLILGVKEIFTPIQAA